MALDSDIAALDAQIQETFDQHRDAKLLLSRPGFGVVLGATFLANTAGNVTAFNSVDWLASVAARFWPHPVPGATSEAAFPVSPSPGPPRRDLGAHRELLVDTDDEPEQQTLAPDPPAARVVYGWDDAQPAWARRRADLQNIAAVETVLADVDARVEDFSDGPPRCGQCPPTDEPQS